MLVDCGFCSILFYAPCILYSKVEDACLVEKISTHKHHSVWFTTGVA